MRETPRHALHCFRWFFHIQFTGNPEENQGAVHTAYHPKGSSSLPEGGWGGAAPAIAPATFCNGPWHKTLPSPPTKNMPGRLPEQSTGLSAMYDTDPNTASAVPAAAAPVRRAHRADAAAERRGRAGGDAVPAGGHGAPAGGALSGDETKISDARG